MILFTIYFQNILLLTSSPLIIVFVYFLMGFMSLRNLSEVQSLENCRVGRNPETSVPSFISHNFLKLKK